MREVETRTDLYIAGDSAHFPKMRIEYSYDTLGRRVSKEVYPWDNAQSGYSGEFEVVD